MRLFMDRFCVGYTAGASDPIRLPRSVERRRPTTVTPTSLSYCMSVVNARAHARAMLAGLAYQVFLDTQDIMIQPVPIATEDWLHPEGFMRPGFLRNRRPGRNRPVTMTRFAQHTAA